MNSFQIEHLTVGPGQRTLVIAEIGVNHDGSLTRAQELVMHAKSAGADVVKLQIFQARQLVHPTAVLAEYQSERCSETSAEELLRRYELPPVEIAHLISYIRAQGMIPLATPFSLGDVDLIENLHLPAIKIASPDLVNHLLLQRCAQLGRPILVSTGAATMEEVECAVARLREWRACFALLHCISAYPTPADQVNLIWISELAESFDVPVGFSDHTTELLSGACAVVAGACIVERHLTWDKSAPGPDHAASSDPVDFAEYVRLVRLAEQLRGGGDKRVLPIEQDVRVASRQSLVLRREVQAGQIIHDADLAAQRPGSGILAADAPRAVGRRARRAIKSGTILTWDMLCDAA